MLTCDLFVDSLAKEGVDFYSGVPDSLLSSLCAYIDDRLDAHHHVVAANEGGAVALAAGYHLATGGVPCVYLQNSGLGNTVNPIISLADPSVYGVPMVLLVGWRGEPGVADEPQHVRQGELTVSLFELLGIPHFLLPKEAAPSRRVISDAVCMARAHARPVAILVQKGTFEAFAPSPERVTTALMSRERAIEAIISAMSEHDVVVSTTGKASRELYELRERAGKQHGSDFLVVGSMGHASEIAAGVALSTPDRRVTCLDGDGALLMHMGSLAVNGCLKLPNFRHIVLNNGAHDSVGGLPTVGLRISVERMAEACGYTSAVSVQGETALRDALPAFLAGDGPSLMNVTVGMGARADLGRPAESPRVCKEQFMAWLQR